MTPDQIAKLKSAAEAATDGKWIYNAGDDAPVVCLDVFDRMTGVQAMIAEVEYGVDAHFIALANPANILSLLDALREKEEEIGRLREALGDLIEHAQNMEHSMYPQDYMEHGPSKIISDARAALETDND